MLSLGPLDPDFPAIRGTKLIMLSLGHLDPTMRGTNFKPNYALTAAGTLRPSLPYHEGSKKIMLSGTR